MALPELDERQRAEIARRWQVLRLALSSLLVAQSISRSSSIAGMLQTTPVLREAPTEMRSRVPWK